MKNFAVTVAAVFFVIVCLLPQGVVLVEAFGGGLGWRRIFEVCFNARALGLLKNTVAIGIGAAALSLILGVPCGFLILRSDLWARRWARNLFMLGLLIAPFISAMAWMKLFETHGFVKNLFDEYAPAAQNFSPGICGILGSVWVLGLSYVPLVGLFVMAGLYQFDKKLEEQAQLVSLRLGVLKKITLPLILPFAAAGALFVFILAVSNYGVPALLRVNTYPVEIFMQFSAFYDHRMAALSSLPLVLLVVTAMISISYFLKGKSFAALEQNSLAEKVFYLGRLRWLCSFFVWGVIFVSGVLPLGVLAFSAADGRALITAVKTSWENVILSLALSAGAATVCAVMGFFLSYALERVRRGRGILNFLVFLTLVIPATVLGIGLIRLWNHPLSQWVYTSAVILVMGFTAQFISLAVGAISGGFRKLHPSLQEAADLSGAHFFKKCGTIFLPPLRPALGLAWCLVFVFSMSELGMSILVAPAGLETLALKIFTIMHYGVGKLAMALALILIMATFLPVVVVRVLLVKAFRYD